MLMIASTVAVIGAITTMTLDIGISTGIGTNTTLASTSITTARRAYVFTTTGADS